MVRRIFRIGTVAISGSLAFALAFVMGIGLSDRAYATEPIAFASVDVVSSKSISTAVVSKIPAKAFAGSPLKPKVTVRLDGKLLVSNRDYTVSYENNVRPGTATVTINGIGAYSGTVTTSFTIKSRYIFIGDSYSSRSSNGFKAWPKLVAADLGLSKNQYKHYWRHGGYGFSYDGKFYDMIKNAPINKKVSDVLIVGGTGNDLVKGKSTITHDYIRTINLIKKKWPNARIMHASPNWHLGKSWYRETMREHLPWYKELAARCGVHYLPSCEKVLHNRRDRVFGDLNHPNQKGQRAIADGLVKDIRALDAR